ncbi:MAG: alpha/beta hydrolase [Planctomycetota bacterium]|nr:alpha/beta hydrolase [Planctomycetota bacterium]MDA0933283.1 alpha/beta hydrolase [Planctomycetota bacterium]
MTTTASTSVKPCTLVALHGNGGGAARFARVASHWPEGLRVEVPELPGFGARGGEAVSHLQMEDYAREVIRFVEACDRPRVLLGHGIGGAFALAALQLSPDLADGIVLHAPVGAHLDQRRFPKLMRPRLVRRLARTVLTSRLSRPWLRRRLFVDPTTIPAAIETGFFGDYRRCSAFGHVFDLITARWFESLEPVRVPAVLLWGLEERVLAPSQAEAFRVPLPLASLRTVEGWGHFPMLETPESYAAVVSEAVRDLLREPKPVSGAG